MWMKIAAIVCTGLAFIAVAVGVQYRDQTERANRRYDACVRDRRQYDTLHDLIEETGKPGPTGSAIDHLVIPPGTDPQTVDILRQLNAPSKPHLGRFYAVLGHRPEC